MDLDGRWDCCCKTGLVDDGVGCWDPIPDEASEEMCIELEMAMGEAMGNKFFMVCCEAVRWGWVGGEMGWGDRDLC